MNDIETTIYTAEGGFRISIDEWDNGGVWLGVQGRAFSMHAVLTRAEAETMINGLQAILAKEVIA